MNWHHRVLCRKLDDLVSGRIKRLMVCMPPRHGKSEVVSRRFPAYILGRQPSAQIIACSYSADLASRMNRDVQRIMDSPEYARIFPETRLNAANVRTAGGGALRNSDIFEIPNHGGVYRSAGVGGGVTGMGATYAILDDPIKNREEADSATYRDKLWEWYCSTFLTRLEKGGCVLLVMTRWHEDDIAGRLLKLAATDPAADQWDVVRFPAEAEGASVDDPRQPGEPLWPNKYDSEALARIQAGIGSYQWASLYQQRPAPASGGIWKTRWWRFWCERGEVRPPVRIRLDDGETVECPVRQIPDVFDDEIQSWDMTFKGLETSKGGKPDYVVGGSLARSGADCYLRDVTRGQWEFFETIQQLVRFSEAWPETRAKLVEDKANGPAIISTLSHKIPGLIAVEPDGDKAARARAVAHMIEAGNVYLPHPDLAPWVWGFIHECSTFPSGEHDDQVDMLSQALRRWSTSTGASYDLSALNDPVAGLLPAASSGFSFGAWRR